MQHLLALAIDDQKIAVPKGIPTGGLPKFEVIAQNAIQIVLVFIVLLAFIFIIVSGIKWITAGGDKTKVQSARGTLTYAIIGLVLALISFFIVTLVGQLITGTNIFKFPAATSTSDPCTDTGTHQRC